MNTKKIFLNVLKLHFDNRESENVNSFFAFIN